MSRNFRHTHHARNRNQARSCRPCLHMMHCSICHPGCAGQVQARILTLCYRPPWDPPECSKFLGVRRVATKPLLSQSRLPRARCSRATRCLLATLRRHCVPPFDSAETASKPVQRFLSILLLPKLWSTRFVTPPQELQTPPAQAQQPATRIRFRDLAAR